jgi:hypothetical protein
MIIIVPHVSIVFLDKQIALTFKMFGTLKEEVSRHILARFYLVGAVHPNV